MEHLLPYIHNPEEAWANFNLGQEYESLGQTGAAISFYLRTAERATTDVEQYEALLRMALCFEKQRTRDDTEKVILQKAMNLLTDRPEAYFLLSRLHERQKEWHDGYTVSCLGMKFSNFDLPPLRTAVDYPGKYGLLFEKGVTAWWVGETEESKEIMYDLKTNYRMDEIHTTAVNNNLKTCGYPKYMPPPTVVLYRGHVRYEPGMRDRIRLSFPGIENIDKNFSQSYHDMFILAANKGLHKGQYLEIGASEPFSGNNTALLETKFNWTGVSIEIDKNLVDDFAAQRKNPIVCADALTLDYAQLLKERRFKNHIEYLQVDCDPPETSLAVLQRIPFDQYTFSVITFEHDYYYDKSVRERSRTYLRSKGYELIVADLAYNKTDSYEDWWVHPDYVDAAVRDKLRDISDGPKFATDYMFPGYSNQSQAAPRVIIQPDNNLFNPNRMSGVWIVDNFYADPDGMRKFALEQDYQNNNDGEQGYIGRRTKQQYLFPGLKEEFERIIGRPITRWEDHGMNGRFQYAKAGEPLVYHCDHQTWAGMLYLTPDAPPQCGTNTYQLRGTDIRHISHPDIQRCFKPGSRNFDKTPFEMVDSFGNVYNRLVIFNAGYLHSAAEYFGYTPENSRLWQMFFFD